MQELLGKLFPRARTSPLWLWALNRILWLGIPFNAPHRLRVKKLGLESLEVSIPFIRRNKNHLGGLHACVMATASEFSSGLLLLQHLSPREYRLIMKSLEIEFHYQGRIPACAQTECKENWIESEIKQPLQNKDRVEVQLESRTYDAENNHLATATITWQLKRWQSVGLS